MNPSSGTTTPLAMPAPTDAAAPAQAQPLGPLDPPISASPNVVSQNPAGDINSRIDQVNNILVTVKSNPTVDELSAALGLTLGLNAIGKHATAVFSGSIPNAMSFLNPEKVFENNVHSLRDFIISLNKDKADKLRFAKDGEIVKIYITPYRSTITPKDLAYDEGDFNVEMVLAIGIVKQEDLDAVIAAHGRILHDATVATINPGAAVGQLGSINWSDPTQSSTSAMIIGLLQTMNIALTPEISTALLTGLVADTDRFSNPNTTPAVMELAAKLMASGADHQLVTSSVGNTPSGIRPAPTPKARQATPINNRELVLNVQDSPPKTATNQTPIAQSVQQNPVVTTPPPATPTPTPQPEVPAPILPPAPVLTTPPPTAPEPTPAPEPISEPVPAPIANPASNTIQGLPTPEPAQDDAAKIKSEIDDIYSSQPFDPANNPRSDLGASIGLPSQSLEPDTSVQKDQASEANKIASDPAPTMTPIEATKEQTATTEQLIGGSKDVVPGLELPEIPPPPPPPPIEGTNPFASPVSFDPSKK